jgi:hypothetical protein
MDTQTILEELLCNDVKIKFAALDRFQQRLRLKSTLSDVTVTNELMSILTILSAPPDL